MRRTDNIRALRVALVWLRRKSGMTCSECGEECREEYR